MSLAQAPKDTTTSPPKNAVIDPVDKEAKEKDVDRKLTFYTTLLALRQSKLPSNAQLDKYLTHWKHLQQPSSDPAKSSLSKDGQKLVRDVQDILETLKVMVREKNQDELIQEFVWGIKAFGDDQLPTATPDTGDVTKDKVKNDAQIAGQHLRTILTLLVTNSEARKLLSDFGLVGRDLLSKGLVKAAEGVAPSEDKLQSVDEEQKGDSFISKEQQEKEKAQLRDMKAKAEEKKEQGKEKKEQAKEKKEQAKEQAKDEAADRAETARQEGIGAATDTPPTSPPKKKGLMERMVGGVKDSIPGEHQDKAKAHYGRGKEFLTEEYFPEDRRDQWIWRVKKVILECQKHSEYQESLEWLITFVKEYASHGRSISSQHMKSQQDQIPSSLNSSLNQLKVILERFASNQSFDTLILDPINALIDDASRDPELREWWGDVGEWVEKCVKEPGYILDEKSNERGRQLQEKGRVFFGSKRPSREEEQGLGSSASPTVGVPGTTATTTAQPSFPPTGMQAAPGPTQLGVNIDPYRVDTLGGGDTEIDKVGGGKRVVEAEEKGKYRAHLDRAIDGARDFVKAMGDDPVNKRLGTDVQRLTKDLLFEGDQLAFKKELWNDVRGVILPGLIEKVGYIPIPRIEYTDETFDLVVENLTLSGRNLFPNVVEVEMRNWMRWETFAKKDVKDKDHPNSHHTFHLHLTQIQADMRDVLFYFHKKGGAIKIKDSGIADLVLGGDGMSVDVHLSASRDPGRLFDIDKVNVKIEGSLKVAIHDSKHDVLYKTLKPLMMGLVKRQVQKAVEGGLRSGFDWISEELMAVKQRMDEARSNISDGDEEKEIGRIKALQEAFKRSPSMSSRDSTSQFKVVANKRNSILGDVGHSGGWVQRVQEREKVIPKAGGEVKSDGTWKSDVFDLSAHA